MKRELKVGDTASITRLFTDEDVRLYADLSTDHNPVHLDEDFAANPIWAADCARYVSE